MKKLKEILSAEQFKRFPAGWDAMPVDGKQAAVPAIAASSQANSCLTLSGSK